MPPSQRSLSPGSQEKIPHKRIRLDDIPLDEADEMDDQSMPVDSRGSLAVEKIPHELDELYIPDQLHEKADRYTAPVNLQQLSVQDALDALWVMTRTAALELGMPMAATFKEVLRSLPEDPGYLNGEIKALIQDKNWRACREHGTSILT